MPIRNSLVAALGALALSTTLATAATNLTGSVPGPDRCHDETSMTVGRLVDGTCRVEHENDEDPYPHGYQLGWGYSPYYYGGDDGGPERPAAGFDSRLVRR